MFKIFNIFKKREEKIEKKKKAKNLEILSEIFSNKTELAILTFSIYFVGVLYQIFKLIGGFTTQPKFGNLMFFSFSNSINDFGIIFGISFIFFFLTFFVVYVINFIFSFINFSNNKVFGYCILLITFLIILFITFYGKDNLEKSTYVIISVPYLISSFIIAILSIHKRKLTKTLFYIFISLFLIYGFLLNLYGGTKYYGCEKIRDNNSEKDCFLLEYKNDKYGFTGSGDIYRLDEFKSFFTYDYFKNKIKKSED